MGVVASACGASSSSGLSRRRTGTHPTWPFAGVAVSSDSQVAANAHAVVILDGAGWHRSQGLVVPSNITLLELPPYSPELNPVERIWHYLPSHWLANSVFASLANIMDACGMALNRFTNTHGLVRLFCAVAWASAPPAL